MAVNYRSNPKKRASAATLKEKKRPARAVDLGTKNEILEAALTAFARDGFEAASRGLSPLHRLRVMVQAFAQFAARYPDHFGLIMAEMRSDSERLVWLRKNYLNAFLSRLGRALKDAQEQNEIKKIPLDHLSFILIGSIVLYFSMNFELPKNVKSEELANRHAKWVLEVILNGITM